VTNVVQAVHHILSVADKVLHSLWQEVSGGGDCLVERPHHHLFLIFGVDAAGDGAEGGTVERLEAAAFVDVVKVFFVNPEARISH